MREYNGVVLSDDIVITLAIYTRLQKRNLNDSVLSDDFITNCGGDDTTRYQLSELAKTPIPVMLINGEWHELVYNNYVFQDCNFK